MTAQGVLQEVLEERVRQDAKWGQQDHADGTGPAVVWSHLGPAAYVAEVAKATTDRMMERGCVTWLDIAVEEVAEAAAEDDPARLRRELVQAAAVFSAWVEAIDRRTAAVEQRFQEAGL